MTRVVAEGVAARDRLHALRRIGIDAISYKKGQRFITIVCCSLHVSADAAQWIADEVALHCPNAVRCADALHIGAGAGDTLDQIRRDTWNTARKGGMSVHARGFKGARHGRTPNVTDRQRAKLVWVAKVKHQLFRAYLLKEQLRKVFRLKEGGKATS